MENEEKQPQEAETPENEGEVNWEAEAKKYMAMADRRKKEIEKLKKEKPSADKSKKDKSEKNDIALSATDESYFFSRGGTRKELSFIKEIMEVKKMDFDTAWKSKLFKAMKAENDALIKKQKAQLDPARGGKPVKVGIKPSNSKERAFLDSMGVKV